MEQVKTKGAVKAAPQTNEKAVKAASQTNEKAVVKDAAKEAAFKAKKAAAAKAWKERKVAKAEADKKTAAELIKFLADKKVVLPENLAKALNEIANPTAVVRATSSTSGVFQKMFGDSPKVGDKVSLMDAFKKTFKSKADIDRLVKGWAEKGIVVEFNQAQNMLESTYTIKALAK